MAALFRISLFSALFALLGSSPALADSFAPLPANGSNNKDLQMRFVRYDGSTNGEMLVEIRNTGNRSRTFAAEGVYFVPTGDPELAPQRLGAAGPFTIMSREGRSDHKNKLVVYPGETKQLSLEVFCIDSHRSSPSSSTKFAVAKTLLPKQLRQEIGAGAQQIIRKNKGDVGKSKSAIQSHMWKTRDKKWIPIEGERKNEKAAPPAQRRVPRNRIQRKQYQQRRLP